MGMNFYYYAEAQCPVCHREHEPRHIGKSSYGWVFTLHVYPDDGIADLDDWQRLFEADGSYIRNEDGAIISAAEMLSRITEREHPRGLRRHDIDNHLCIAHGAGTWDLCIGEFS